MKCKQDDLAIYVGPLSPEYIGRIVRCVSFMASPDGTPAWIVDPPLYQGYRVVAASIRCGDWIFDHALIPIGNPRSDAVDETLSWLPVPSKEQEHA